MRNEIPGGFDGVETRFCNVLNGGGGGGGAGIFTLVVVCDCWKGQVFEINRILLSGKSECVSEKDMYTT